MKHDIIITQDYLVIKDDSEIKAGDWVIGGTNTIIRCLHPHNIVDRDVKKIIAHLPITNAPVMESVDLLPHFENDNVGKMYEFMYDSFFEFCDDTAHCYFVKGYNKAKEVYKWSDEDVIRIVEKSRETGLTAEYLMMLFQQQRKYPIGFECKMRTKQMPEFHEDLPKKIINSKGETEWVGNYIFRK